MTEEILRVIARSTPFTFDDISYLYSKVKSIDKTIALIKVCRESGHPIGNTLLEYVKALGEAGQGSIKYCMGCGSPIPIMGCINPGWGNDKG